MSVKMLVRRLAPFVFCLSLCAAGALAAADPAAVIGRAETRYTGVGEPDSRSAETGVGNAVADAARLSAGTELAVIPGGLIENNIIAGDVTYERLEILFDAAEPLAVAELSPAELIAFLEESLSHIVLDDAQAIDHAASAFDGYPQISGFTMRVDVSAPAGGRVLELALDGGAKLSRDDTRSALRVASVQSLFDGSRGLPPVAYTLCGTTVLEAMAGLAAAGGLSGETLGRVRVVGSSDDTLLGDFPVALAALILIFLIAAARLLHRPKPSFENGFQLPPKSERFDDLSQPR